jgi:uncharacterized damage-inducible protein DinB
LSKSISDHNEVQQAITRTLTGKDAHVETANVLQGLDWKLAGVRPDGVPHSIFQLVNHIVYWQEWAVNWLDGKKPRPPRHASGSWPGKEGPASRREWERTTQRLEKALRALQSRTREADLLSRHGNWTPLEMLLVIGSHTSYHVGQITSLRQALGVWPPPSGAVTW